MNIQHKDLNDVPEVFCWTRFGTEAGETIGDILVRKEAERRANRGVFLWGIGNSVGPGIQALASCSTYPEVLFSPIKGVPKAADVTPDGVLAWTRARTLSGADYQIPEHSLVTSRLITHRPKRVHYALVCCNVEPLTASFGSALAVNFKALRNLVSGNPLGASQVTAVVKRDIQTAELSPRDYPVAFRARLVEPYFIRLVHSVEVREAADPDGFEINEVHSDRVLEGELIGAPRAQSEMELPLRSF